MATSRDDPAWQAALVFCERLYRAAATIRSGGDSWLAGHLAEAALALPAASREPAALTPHLLAIETALALAVRLRMLSEGEDLLAALDRYRAAQAALPKAAAPAPAPPLRAPAATPATPKPAATVTAAPTVASPSTPVTAGPAERDVLLVDGCNFLGRAGGYELGDEGSRGRLLTRLHDYAHRYPAQRIVAVFDGQKSSVRTVGNVEERVTAAAHSADDALIDTLRALASGARKRAVVVTDDRELGGRARVLGARVEGVAWLASRLKEPPARTVRPGVTDNLSRRQVSEWEDYFSKPPQRPGS